MMGSRVVRIHLLAATLLELFAAGCSPSPEHISNNSADPELVHTIDSIMAAQADSGFVGVALVAVGDEVLFHKAYRGNGAAIDTSTAFYIASLTKQFTAAAMMKLVEQSKVNLNDSLGRFFPNAPLEKQAITIKQLLSHTSGIGEVEVEDLTDRDSAVARILAAPLDHLAGEFQYQNTNYQLAAAIIERVAKQPWDVFVRSRLLEPAGLDHTGFWGHEDEVGVRVSPAHDSIRYYPTYAKTFHNGKPRAIWGMAGSGAMFSTARDMYRWSQALLHGRVLNETSRETLFTAVATVRTDTTNGTNVGYALGWVVETQNGERKEVRHTGHGDWTNNSMLRILENGAVIFTIAEDEGPNAEPMAYAAADALDGLMRSVPSYSIQPDQHE